MASSLHANGKESAGETGWCLLYQRARRLMVQESYSSAADVLRMLALAAPGEPDVWNALADCHDAEGRSDIGDSLRSLGRLIQLQLRPETRSP